MADNQRVLQCYYCGNSTLMNLVGAHKNCWAEDDGSYYGYYNYQMFECPVCGKVTFCREYWDCTQYYCKEDGKFEDIIDKEIIYPINSFQGKYLPREVKEAYEAALKTKNIDSAVCLIALRRTLEVICKEKDAQGKSLWHKIEYLANKGILPVELKHASNITKTYGNIGAHDSDVSIHGYEIEQIIEFVKYIIDYLYVLPAKLSSIQEQLEKRKQKNEKKNMENSLIEIDK